MSRWAVFVHPRQWGARKNTCGGARSSLEQLQVAWRHARQELVLALELEVMEHGFSAKTDLQPLRDFYKIKNYSNNYEIFTQYIRHIYEFSVKNSALSELFCPVK